MSEQTVIVAPAKAAQLAVANDFNVTVNDPGDAVKVHGSDATQLKRAGVAEDLLAVANAIPNQTGTNGQPFTYTIPANTFSGGAENTLTAVKGDGSALPGWMSFDPATRVLSGTAATSTTAVRITAKSRGGQVISDEFNVTVS